MFLWCGCHCGPDEGSKGRSDYGESLSGIIESYSSGDPARPDPPDPPMPVTGCASCQYGAAPAAYDMTWSYTGTPGTQHRPCCSVYAGQSTYRLYFRVAKPGDSQCVWTANEHVGHAARLGQGGCFFPAQTGGRVTLAVPQRVGVAGGGAEYRMRLTIRYAWDYNPLVPLGDLAQTVKPSDVTYDRIKDDGTFWKGYNDQSIPCLTTLTFKRTNTQPIWNGTDILFGGQPYGAPCQQVLFSGFDLALPEFLTITPVRT